MTSRPGPGIQESLQQRGAGPSRLQPRRQPSKPTINPQHGQRQELPIDPALDTSRTPSDDAPNITRALGINKPKPGPLDGLQAGTVDQGRRVPKGKPQLFFSNAVGNHGLENQGGQLQSPLNPPSSIGPALPMPPRPGSSFQGELSQMHPPLLPGRIRNQEEIPITNQNCDAPPVVFPGGKVADLFPWNGNHPEDTLSEALVKSGISNKPQVMTEMNTARPSLWSNLKNKSGLNTLSTLFVAVLEKRQACGRLTSTNSFKPPPRLTLRDSVREAWLHDLANPTVALRRLSRTIPHGITGKALLEQCLNKSIPIPRAIWLAKCVGINEMRAHKRKGQAGAITWVRGWTTSVIQFLESIFSSIGQQDWKLKITYGLRLAAYLYKDHLLEEDHFLEWVLKSLESSAPERLFIWLLLVSMYFKDLIGSRRRGKRLAEALLQHADKHFQEDGDNNSKLHSFLDDVIIKLVTANRSCLILPRSWNKCSRILHRLATRHPNPNLTQLVEDLDRRNGRLTRPSGLASTFSQHSSQTLVSLLDSVDYGRIIPIEELSSDCIDLISDMSILVTKTLHWASSIYREGLHRVYLAVRLLRTWSRLGFDTDAEILAFLRTMAPRRDIDLRNIFKIVAELTRSSTFSVGRYLRWLIATGSLNASQDLSQPAAWPLRLVTEIPLSGLPPQVQNLRYTLLQGAGYPVHMERVWVTSLQSSIRLQIPNLFDVDLLMDTSTYLEPKNVSPTVQLELSSWLRQHAANNVELVEHIPTKDPSLMESGMVSTIAASDFYTIRSYLEQFEDISMLADLIKIVSSSLDYAVLAAATDTLHYHYKAFSALGAFKPLFQKVVTRYMSLRGLRLPERDIVVSLLDLAQARKDDQLIQIMGYDLSRCDQKNYLAACSPVSDNMTEVNSSLENDDEIDRILSSGTSMDVQIMGRVFIKIISKLEISVSKGSSSPDRYASWFYRLRSFEEKAFEQISADWVSSLLLNHRSHLLAAALPPLVASGCLSLTQILDIPRQSAAQSTLSNEGIAALQVEALDAILPGGNTSPFCHPHDSYRYRLEQRKFSEQMRVLSLIGQVIELGSTDSSKSSPLFSSVTDRMRACIRHFAIVDMHSLTDALHIGSSRPETVASYMKSILDDLLDPSDVLYLRNSSLEDQVTTIVNSADELSLPFCQLQLRHLFSARADSVESSDLASIALLEAIKTAVDEDRDSWLNLVSGLDDDLSSKIREYAEREILNQASLPSMLDKSQQDDEASIKRYLSVLGLTASDKPLERQSPTFTSLIDKLKGIVEALGKTSDLGAVEGSITIDAVLHRRLILWLDALMQLSAIHVPILPSNTSNQSRAAFLWCLRALFTHNNLQTLPSLTEFIFDVAAVFSDSISEEVRSHLSKLDAAKPVDDTRCAFIFGSSPPLDGWLGLIKPSLPPSVPPSATSQPQPGTPLQTPGPAYPSQLNSPGPAPMQRTLSQQQFQTQNRMYTQYPPYAHQTKPMALPQFPQMNPRQTPHQAQFQQMQQMQGLQRSATMSPIPSQRAGQPQNSGVQSPGPVGSGATKAGPARQDKPEFSRPIPFPLRRWEIIPESGGNPNGNETTLSLTLFGARKV